MIKKTILPILLVLILVFAMMPMAASAEDAGTGHAGQDGWTEWNDEKKLPNEAGKYYLTKDVTIKASWSVPEGKTTLCLNGKTIKLELPEGKTGRVINIANHDKLTICDHSSGGSGRITGGNADYGALNIGSGENEEIRDITISGNKKGDGKTDNIYLPSGNMINFTGEVSAASKIGVTTESQPANQAPVVFTSGLSGKGNISNFFSDRAISITARSRPTREP